MTPGPGKPHVVVEALVRVVVPAKLLAPVIGENSLLLAPC
jgi:hypothetical protein